MPKITLEEWLESQIEEIGKAYENCNDDDTRIRFLGKRDAYRLTLQELRARKEPVLFEGEGIVNCVDQYVCVDIEGQRKHSEPWGRLMHKRVHVTIREAE